MQQKFLIACSICMLSLASNVRADFKPVEGVTLEEMLGGEKIKRIIAASPVIQVFRLGDLKRIPPPVKFPSVEAGDVIAALSDVKNYGVQYLCEFESAVKFRFTTNEGILDIVICFNCGEMRLHLDGRIVKRNIRFVGSQNSFSPAARRAFVALAKKAFPEDEKLQKLRD